jgi:hypothetical protein
MRTLGIDLLNQGRLPGAGGIQAGTLGENERALSYIMSTSCPPRNWDRSGG